MKIFTFLKSHKYIVFGLIFSFCLCFIRPIPSTADDSLPGEFTFGCVNSSGVSDSFSNNQPLNIFQYANQGADQILSSTWDSRYLRDFCDYVGLTNYFINWDVYNPSFYVNIYFYYNSPSSIYFALDFRKQTFNDLDYNSYVYSNEVLFSNTSGFPSVTSGGTQVFFPSLPKNFYLSVSNNSQPFYISRYYTDSWSDIYAGTTYSFSTSTDVSSLSLAFSSFLSDSDSFSFCVSGFGNSSSWTVWYGTNVGCGTGLMPGTCFECPLSTFSVYNFDSVALYNYVNSDPHTLAYYHVSSPFFLYGSLFTQGMSFESFGLPTPTPIPSPGWVTPTLFPTVTPVPVTLTPIPQYINPDLDIDSTEVKSALSGYLDIIDNTFSNFAIFSLGSQVLSYLYSFSSYFSFVLLIPAICLIAYAIGRLNQK